MGKPKIVILRGMPTAGKSTTYENLKPKLKNYTFLDHVFLKNVFSNLKEGKSISKKILFVMMKEAMKQWKNIIIEEMSPAAVKKYLRDYIKEYNYSVISFRFTTSLESAYKRDKLRNKKTMGKSWIRRMKKIHEQRADKSDIIVDSDKMDQKQVVDFIIEQLGRKH